ncbi:MAG: VanZ family protein [Bacteroidales bacterium]|nr:VanZ family protein [Bacteroidales bacterium]
MAKMIKTITTKYLFLAYFVVILLLVVLPLNTTESLNTITILQFRGDYFLHAIAFSGWALFGQLMNRKLVVWLILGIAFATLTEGLQYLLPYRAFNINDLIANTIGIISGFVVFIPVTRWVLKRKAKK